MHSKYSKLMCASTFSLHQNSFRYLRYFRLDKKFILFFKNDLLIYIAFQNPLILDACCHAH